jgi:hypothetical protein
MYGAHLQYIHVLLITRRAHNLPKSIPTTLKNCGSLLVNGLLWPLASILSVDTHFHAKPLVVVGRSLWNFIQDRFLGTKGRLVLIMLYLNTCMCNISSKVYAIYHLFIVLQSTFIYSLLHKHFNRLGTMAETAYNW